MKTAKTLASSFGGAPPSVTLLGPSPAPLYRLRGKYRWRLLVRASREVNLPDFLRRWTASLKPPSSVRVKIDIDPGRFL